MMSGRKSIYRKKQEQAVFEKVNVRASRPRAVCRRPCVPPNHSRTAGLALEQDRSSMLETYVGFRAGGLRQCIAERTSYCCTCSSTVETLTPTKTTNFSDDISYPCSQSHNPHHFPEHVRGLQPARMQSALNVLTNCTLQHHCWRQFRQKKMSPTQ